MSGVKGHTKDWHKVQQWLYEDGPKPFDVQPETHLFDLIIDITEGVEPWETVRELRSVGMAPDTVGRYEDYFIALAIKAGKLKQIIFIE